MWNSSLTSVGFSVQSFVDGQLGVLSPKFRRFLAIPALRVDLSSAQMPFADVRVHVAVIVCTKTLFKKKRCV